MLTAIRKIYKKKSGEGDAEGDPDEPDISYTEEGINQVMSKETTDEGNKRTTKETQSVSKTTATISVGKAVNHQNADNLRKIMEQQMFTLNMSRNLMSKLSPVKKPTQEETSSDIFDIIVQKKQADTEEPTKEPPVIIDTNPPDYVSPFLRREKEIEGEQKSKMKEMAAEILESWKPPRLKISRSPAVRKEGDANSPKDPKTPKPKKAPPKKSPKNAKADEPKEPATKRGLRIQFKAKEKLNKKPNSKKPAEPTKKRGKSKAKTLDRDDDVPADLNNVDIDTQVPEVASTPQVKTPSGRQKRNIKNG